MKVYYSSTEAKDKNKKLVLALGNFDGVHLAHQKMLQWCKKLAKTLKAKPGVCSFDPHPVKFLSPASAPPLIYTLKQKLHFLKKNGVKVLVLETFDQQLANLSPRDFFEKILINKLHVTGLVVGYDFTFGKSRSGNLKVLQDLCIEHKVVLKILPAFHHKNTLVSSTQIRHFILNGKILQANLLLGRPFSVNATVVKGQGIGRTLNFPTANLLVENELLPLSGVYATLFKVGLRKYRSVTNIGWRPTFSGHKFTIETHVMGMNKNIYGKKVRLSFIDRIRDEMKFETPVLLVTQIEKDIISAKSCFKNYRL